MKMGIVQGICMGSIQGLIVLTELTQVTTVHRNFAHEIGPAISPNY